MWAWVVLLPPGGLDGRREGWGPSAHGIRRGGGGCLPGSGEGVTYQIFPDRFRRTGSRSHRHGGRANVTPAGRRAGLPPTRTARCATGTSSAAIWPACGKAGLPAGRRVDTLYFCPIFEAPRTTAPTAPGTMRRSTPCWAPRPTSAPCAPTPPRLGMQVVLDGVFNPRATSAATSTATAPMSIGGRSVPRIAPITLVPLLTLAGQIRLWWGIYSLPAVNEADPLLPPVYLRLARGHHPPLAGPPGRTAGGWTWPTSCPTTLSGITPPPGRPSRRR